MKSNRPKLLIDWASNESAIFACKNYHYSKTIPCPPTVRLGVWEDKNFIGVLIFSRGASPDLLTPYGLKANEGCELTRIALSKHINPVSKIISICIKIIKKTFPSLKLIISFADKSKGHYGGVYQASNFIYCGQSSPSIEYFKDGKRYHPRQLSEKGYTIQFNAKRICPKPSECKKIKVPGKYRYIYVLDDNLRENILKLSIKYPKRDEHESNAPKVHLGESGVIPTITHQNQNDNYNKLNAIIKSDLNERI